MAFLFGYELVLRPRGTTSAEPLRFDGGARAPLERFGTDEAVRNVVLLVGDGMGFSHLLAGRTAKGSLEEPLFLERFPATGWMTTTSWHRVYTDSASSATALATGRKTFPGRLAVDVDGRPLRTVAEAARAAGKSAGLVTDSYLWDATPSAFVVHVEDRDEYAEVAAAMAASGVELAIGEEHRTLGLDGVRDTFTAHGYQIAATPEELRRVAASPSPVLGLFPRGAIADPEEPPELGELASVALARLALDPEGFFLLVETEETDTGSHRLDYPRVARGVRTLDAVAEQVVDFARRDGHTLVVAMADHETGGLMLIDGRAGEPLELRWGSGQHTAAPVPLLAYGPGAERFAGVHDDTDVAGLLADVLGVELTGARAALEAAQPPQGGNIASRRRVVDP